MSVSATNLDGTLALRDSDLPATERVRAFVQSTISVYDRHHHEISVFLKDAMPRIWADDDEWSTDMRDQVRAFEKALVPLLSGVVAGSDEMAVGQGRA